MSVEKNIEAAIQLLEVALDDLETDPDNVGMALDEAQVCIGRAVAEFMEEG